LERKLPAVSCSSGRLVAEHLTSAHAEPSYPGQLFADPDRPYAQAMLAFVAASAAPSAPIAESTIDTPAADAGSRPVTIRALRHQARAVRDQRLKVRAQRRQEDAAWRTLRCSR
jgi:hypothetical protein